MKRALVILSFIIAYGLFVYHTIREEFLFTSHDVRTIFGLALLYILLGLFPITFRGTAITFTNALSLATFLLYGFYIEAWLMQFAVLVTLLIIRAKGVERYLINLLMFLAVSYLASRTFYLIEGPVEASPTLEQLPYLGVIGYVIVTFIVNHTFLLIAGKILYNRWRITSLAHVLWEFSFFIIISPLGILLYVFYQQLGFVALLYFGIPMILFSFILKIYNEIEKVHSRLKSLKLFSSRFSATLNMDESLKEIFATINYLFSCDYSYILYIDKDGKNFRPIGLTGDIEDEKRQVFLNKKLNRFQSLSDLEPSELQETQSRLSVPIIRNKVIIGRLIILNKNKGHYGKNDQLIIRILANQAGIALYNAYQYEATEKNVYVDELTELLNFRAFDTQVYRALERCKLRNTNLSLLIIDIDHFKRINDTHGHMAGNQVLREIATFLKDRFINLGKVYRYGGEEFIILLPDIDQEEAYHHAEEVRQLIENYELGLTGTLLEEDKVHLNVTVSIGVATYPHQAKSANDLLRNADRAMYMGAKQAGRNRVAIYTG